MEQAHTLRWGPRQAEAASPQSLPELRLLRNLWILTILPEFSVDPFAFEKMLTYG
jgi:hypothetical protein